MKIKIKGDWAEECIREMAQKAIENHKIFEYMVFWIKEPVGWQKKAKQYLQEGLRLERKK